MTIEEEIETIKGFLKHYYEAVYQVNNLTIQNKELQASNASLTTERNAAVREAKSQKDRADRYAAHPDVIAAAEAKKKAEISELETRLKSMKGS